MRHEQDEQDVQEINARADAAQQERAEAAQEVASAEPGTFDPNAVLGAVEDRADTEVSEALDQLGKIDGDEIRTVPNVAARTGRRRSAFQRFTVVRGISEAQKRDLWEEAVTAEEVVSAWSAVLDAGAVTEAAVAEVDRLRDAAQGAEDARLRAVRAAAAAGEPTPKVKATPKGGSLPEAEAAALGALDRLQQVRSEYEAALSASGAREALQDELYPRAASAALEALEAAQEAVSRFVSVKRAAAAEAVRVEGRSSTQEAGGFHAVEANLRKVCEVVAAQAQRPISEPKLAQMSRVERLAISQSGDLRSRRWLQRIEEQEAKEGKPSTTYMKGIILGSEGMDAYVGI